MINTVLFDLGNVILPFDVTRLANRLTKYTHLNSTQIVNNLWNDYIADTFETGRMSPTEYFAHITTLCQFKSLTYNEFIPLFNDIFDVNHGVVELISQLKGRYKLGIISNTNQIHMEHIVSTYTAIGHFDRHWWSNEAGARKPDPAIYHMAIDHFGIQPKQAVFIDDLAVNITSARNVGLNAIHFQGIDPLKTELQKLGVLK